MARKFPDGVSVSCKYGDGVYLGRVIGWDGDAQRYNVGLIGLTEYNNIFRFRNLFPTNNQGQLPIVKIQTHHLSAVNNATIEDVWHRFVCYIYSMFSPSSQGSDRSIDNVFNVVFTHQRVLPSGELQFAEYTSTWRF